MKKSILFLSLMGVTLISCKYEKINADPASFLAGEYISDYYGRKEDYPIPYPINGQSVTMTITKVSNDTVSIDIQSAPNDKYSPGGNLAFPKAYIESRSAGNGKYSYNVFFYSRKTNSLVDALQFYESDNSFADYYYIPAGGNPSFTRILRFKRK